MLNSDYCAANSSSPGHASVIHYNEPPKAHHIISPAASHPLLTCRARELGYVEPEHFCSHGQRCRSPHGSGPLALSPDQNGPAIVPVEVICKPPVRRSHPEAILKKGPVAGRRTGPHGEAQLEDSVEPLLWRGGQKKAAPAKWLLTISSGPQCLLQHRK